MPAQLDLTGRRFGRLLVVAAGPMVMFGRMMRSWVCRCDCGGSITVPQRRLQTGAKPLRRGVKIDACDDCRAHPCRVCGMPISPSSTAVTCSPECHDDYTRTYQREYVRTRIVADCEYRDRLRERAAEAYRKLDASQRLAGSRKRRAREIEMHGIENLRRRERQWHAERMNDPEYRERRRQRTNQWRADHLDDARALNRAYRRRQRELNAAREIGEIVAALNNGGDDDRSDDT